MAGLSSLFSEISHDFWRVEEWCITKRKRHANIMQFSCSFVEGHQLISSCCFIDSIGQLKQWFVDPNENQFWRFSSQHRKLTIDNWLASADFCILFKKPPKAFHREIFKESRYHRKPSKLNKVLSISIWTWVFQWNISFIGDLPLHRVTEMMEWRLKISANTQNLFALFKFSCRRNADRIYFNFQFNLLDF